jgi:SAM-dependent methyltransferase
MVRPPIIASSFSQVMERCGFFGEVHRILSEFSDLPLPDQLDVERFGRVLDVACGDGMWLLEMARLNPELSFVGVDADSWAGLAACRQANASRLDNTLFLVANLYELSQLKDIAEFSANRYDLVHGRFLAPYTSPFEWQKLIAELWRLCKPGGCIMLTESAGFTTNSAAWSQGWRLIEQAIAHAGYTPDVTHILDVMLADAPCRGVRAIPATLDISAGTAAGLRVSRILSDVLQLVQPFLIKMEVASECEITHVCQGMVLDLCYNEHFVGTWSLATVLGEKPL